MITTLKTFGFILTLVSVSINCSAEEKYAILTGVWKYPNLIKYRQLVGPRNDVVLMRRLLMQAHFKAKNIVVLTDDIDKSLVVKAKKTIVAISPTRNNIIASLKKLLLKVKKNDLVYLYFSGHGSQQPITKGEVLADEEDALDEIFLPADVGRWDGSVGNVKNSISDNEFRVFFTRFRKKGAHLLVVFDACHSGTLYRAAINQEIRTKRIPPSELGISQHEFAFAKLRFEARSRKQHSISPLKLGGSLIVLSASQDHQLTQSRNFSSTNEEQGRHGVFTYTLYKVLSSNPSYNYRQLIRAIFNEYKANGYLSTMQPNFSLASSQLDSLVFVAPLKKTRRRWLIKNHGQGFKIEAGLLNGLSMQTVLVLVNTKEQKKNKRNEKKFYFKVGKVGLFESTLLPIKNKPNALTEYVKAKLSVEISSRNLNFGLTVALPKKADVNRKDYFKLLTVIKLMKKLYNKNIVFKWVSAKENADIDLEIRAVKSQIQPIKNIELNLVLLPSYITKELAGKQTTLSVNFSLPASVVAKNLSINLQRIAKVKNLMKLTPFISASAMKKQSYQVDISFAACSNLKKDELKKCDLGQPSVIKALSKLLKSETSYKIAKYSDGLLNINIKNTGRLNLCITLLAINADYTIDSLYPYQINNVKTNVVEIEDNQIDSGKEKNIPIGLQSKRSKGLEHLYLIATHTEYQCGAEHTYTELANIYEPKYTVKRGSSETLKQLLIRAGFSNSKKSSVLSSRGASEQGSIWVHSYIKVQ